MKSTGPFPNSFHKLFQPFTFAVMRVCWVLCFCIFLNLPEPMCAHMRTLTYMKNVVPRLDGDRVHSQVEDAGLGKSGFSLNHTSCQDLIIGRIHVTGKTPTMPGDKFEGSNHGEFTLNTLSVPMMTRLNASQFNFYIPFRALDRSFEEAMCPTKSNGMNQSWSAPMFTLKELIYAYVPRLIQGTDVLNLISFLQSSTTRQALDAQMTSQMYTNYRASINYITSSFTQSGIYTDFKNVYLADVMADYKQYIDAQTVGSTATLFEARLSIYNIMFKFFFGEGSLLDELGYNYLRYADLYQLANTVTDGSVNTLEKFCDLFDDTPCNEYLLRAYTAVWVEWFRSVDLEPLTDALRWKNWSSTPVVKDNLWMLVHRVRSWRPDMFIQASPDDICRHVWAPIFAESSGDIQTSDSSRDFLDTESYSNSSSPSFSGIRGVSTFKGSYTDPLSGQLVTAYYPIPGNVNDSLSRSSLSDVDVFGLDLFNLRQAQNAERYLKRIFYFQADEYQQAMLAQYNSYVRDLRVNRPELLSASLNEADRKQEIANVSTEAMEAGTRTATATITMSGDPYSFYAEEFGVVLNICTVVPDAQYAGILPQHMMQHVTDFPIPVFANNNEEFGRAIEIATNGLAKVDKDSKLLYCFGHYPYAHAWRSRVNEVHGSFLSSRQNYSFRRFFSLDGDDTIPHLNYSFLHCLPNLGMFVNQIRLDGQMYGMTTHVFNVERVLPVPVEVI